MVSRLIRQFLPCILSGVLVACGGGGGGSGDSGGGDPILPPPPPALPSALNFETPGTFANGQSFVTERSVISVSGELNSTFIPRGFCPDSQPPQNFSVRWSNAATGASGTAPMAIGCVTIVGVPGIKSQFIADGIELEPGNNRLTFETFEGSSQIGRDEALIVREDTVAPSITDTYPAAGQEEVPTDHALVVIFNEPMNPSTLTGDRFTVLDSTGTPVAGEVFYDERSNTWTLRPTEPLAPDESYSATVSGLVQDAAGGNPLSEDFVWNFRSGADADIGAPIVSREWPGSQCDCAPVSTRIMAGLSEFADPSSVTDNSIKVSAAGVMIAGTTVYRGDFLEFIPDEELIEGVTYEVSVSGNVLDLSGRAMATDHGWQFTTDNRNPVGTWFEMSQDQPPPAMSGAKAVWNGTEVLIWGSAGGGRYSPGTDQWDVNSGISVGGPSTRFGFSAVWAGSRMIVWGGRASATTDAEIFGDGSAYSISGDQWQTVTTPDSATSFPTFDHTAVWTGTEMIVWGGMADTGGSSPEPVNSGWRHVPGTATMTAFTGSNAPTRRSAAASVWTGTEMIVWGGIDENGNPLNDGARYDPVSDSWTPLPPVSESLVAGEAFSAIWSGTEMIAWNGGQTAPGQTFNNQLREPTLHFYDPVTDTWRVSTSGWEPYLAGADPFVKSFAASGYFAFWTGDRMFVAGLYPGDRSYLYDPATDSWQPASDALGVGRKGAAAVWAGSRFVIWGGSIGVLPGDDGLVFQP